MKQSRFIAAFVLLFTLISAPALATDMRRTMNNERDYIVYVPPSAPQRAPLLIAYHDSEFDVERFKLQTRLEDYANGGGFILVMPVMRGERWQDGTYGVGRDIKNDIVFTNDIVKELITDLGIDTTRIYAAGMGAGGFMAQSYACYGRYKLAGIAIVAAALDKDVAAHCNVPPLDVIFAHGSEDRFFLREGWVYKNSPYHTTEDSVNFWIAHNGCKSRDAVRIPAKDAKDKTSVVRMSFGACENDTTVDYFDIGGGGHLWPGSFKREKPDYGHATGAINMSGLVTNMAGAR